MFSGWLVIVTWAGEQTSCDEVIVWFFSRAGSRDAERPNAGCTYNPAAGTCLPCAYPRRIVSPIASATCPLSFSVSRNRRSYANTFTFLLIHSLRLAGSTSDYDFQ